MKRSIRLMGIGFLGSTILLGGLLAAIEPSLIQGSYKTKVEERFEENAMQFNGAYHVLENRFQNSTPDRILAENAVLEKFLVSPEIKGSEEFQKKWNEDTQQGVAEINRFMSSPSYKYASLFMSIQQKEAAQPFIQNTQQMVEDVKKSQLISFSMPCDVSLPVTAVPGHIEILTDVFYTDTGLYEDEDMDLGGKLPEWYGAYKDMGCEISKIGGGHDEEGER